MKNLRLNYILLLLLLPLTAGAQKLMTLDEAIMQALNNNYSLKISRNDQAIAENNVTLAPFLPTLDGSARQQQTNNSEKTATTEYEDSRTNYYNVGASLKWTIFDGFGMFADYSRQKQMLAMSTQNVKIDVENLVMAVCSEYYNIIVQENRLQSVRTSLALSRSRYETAQEKYMLGVISGLELQQARIDLNIDSSTVLSQQKTVTSSYILLAKKLNAGHEITFSVEDTIVLAPEMNSDTLRSRTLRFNNQLILVRQGEQLSQYDLNSVRALRYPSLNFSTGYNFTRNEYPWEADHYSQVKGLNWGLGLTWNIFTGFETQRRISNAKIEIENSKLAYLDIENEILGDLDLLYNTYRNSIIVTMFETESAEVARNSLEIAMERYRLGSLSGLEFREYQNKYLDAINRRLSALYLAKVSEIGLRLLAGELTE
jgi:outer membrane protein